MADQGTSEHMREHFAKKGKERPPPASRLPLSRRPLSDLTRVVGTAHRTLVNDPQVIRATDDPLRPSPTKEERQLVEDTLAGVPALPLDLSEGEIRRVGREYMIERTRNGFVLYHVGPASEA